MKRVLLIMVVTLVVSIEALADVEVLVSSAKGKATVDTQLVKDIEAACAKYSIPCEVFTSILAVESMFRVDAYNSRTKDYGIGQVNKFNIKAMGLDKQRLLTDRQYALDASAKILAHFYKRFAKREPDTWFCRYNIGYQSLERSGVLRACTTYVRKVNGYLTALK